MPNNVKQEEDIEIKEKLLALLLMNQRDPDGIDEYFEFCVRDFRQVINQQVIQALEQARDKIKDGGYDSSYELSVVSDLIKEYKGE